MPFLFAFLFFAPFFFPPLLVDLALLLPGQREFGRDLLALAAVAVGQAGQFGVKEGADR